MAKHVSRKLKIKRITKPYYGDKSKATDVSEAVSDDIVDYLTLCKNLESHIATYSKIWKFTLEENLVLYQLDVSHHPVIKVSIKVDRELKVDVFTRSGKVHKKYMQSLLNQEQVLRHWSELKRLLKHFGTVNSYNQSNNVKYYLSQSMKYLRYCQDSISLEDHNITFKAKLEFLSSQMQALVLNVYTPSMLFLAYSIYLKSSSCYKHIQSLDFLILPQEEDLVKYAYDADITDEESKKISIYSLSMKI